MARRRGSINRGLTITKLILEQVAEFGVAMLDSFFPAKYPEARLWRSLLGLDSTYRFEQKTFKAILYRLRSQGLVGSSRRDRHAIWHITARGRQELERKNDKKARRDGMGRVVVFDIPEQMRNVRDAVRYELAAAGFVQLQKSVWYGERPLRREFFDFADALQLRRYLYIFSIREKGTLPRLGEIIPSKTKSRKRRKDLKNDEQW